jgi:hypothetical protein
MADLNQGASIEAELLPCPECENEYLAIRTDIYKDQREFVYCDRCGCMTGKNVWNLIARRTPADAVGAGELPPLLTDSQIEALWARHADTAKPGERRIAFGRAVERASIAADRAQRKQADAPASAQPADLNSSNNSSSSAGAQPDQRESACWHCGGTGVFWGTDCGACAGQDSANNGAEGEKA